MSKADEIVKRSKGLKKFKEAYSQMDSREVQLEILRELQGHTEVLERTRKNTSIMVWWLIVIPIILALIYLFFIWLYRDQIF